MCHRILCVAVLAVGALVCTGLVTAQDTAAARRPRLQFFPRRTVTSVPFNGTRCFIALVPIDTSNIDHMPIAGQVLIWPNVQIERNIQILPDSLLRRFPRKEGHLK